MQIRDRIKEFRRVHTSQLQHNSKNWRTHPADQREKIRDLISEVGFADALLARELEDGTLELIDGHLRAETAPDAIVPVLILDVDEQEANKLLVTFDSITNLAAIDYDSLSELLNDTTFEHQSLETMLNDISDSNPLKLKIKNESEPEISLQLHELYQVVIECENEQDQQEIYHRMKEEGRSCRLLML